MSLMRKEIFEQPEALRRCIESNRETAKKLAAVLKEKQIKNVNMAARGTSDNACVYGKYMIESVLGYPVGLGASSIVTVFKTKMDFGGSLVVGVSQSGAAQDVLEYIEQGKRTGAVTVTITNDEQSPLAKAADFHLFCHAFKEESVAATKTFTTEMMAMLLLTAEWADSDALRKAIDEIPAAMEKALPDIEKSAAEIAGKVAGLEDCVVLSRGYTYPIALEATLKIQETCYVKAKGYSTADFYHGPLALASEDLTTMVIAPDGRFCDEIREMGRVLDEKGAKVIAVTANEAFASSATYALRIPSVDEFISPYICAAAIQCFACELSKAKGLNPDVPRNLKKVTITR